MRASQSPLSQAGALQRLDAAGGEAPPEREDDATLLGAAGAPAADAPLADAAEEATASARTAPASVAESGLLPMQEPRRLPSLRPGAVLRQADLSGKDLSGMDLSGADLQGACLEGANLRGACLRGANLSRAELLGADLSSADLSDCIGSQAGFGHARLDNARLFGAKLDYATLTAANLSQCDLTRAVLDHSRARDAQLEGALCHRSSWQHADLSDADIGKAQFVEADLRGARLRGVQRFASASFVSADVREVDFAGAYLVRRHILDQNYLHEFRRQSRLHQALYLAWWLTSDCGRSLMRWAALTAAITVGFGWGYQHTAVSYPEPITPLSPYYFSLVTLTTLGYGDVLPTSQTAQALVMIEVVLGHLLFGGLLSILSTKLARRAE